MSDHKRRFRPRNQKKGFSRGRSSNHRGSNNHFQANGNANFNRNGSMTNPFNVEKTVQKYVQLAKDAQSMGDPVLNENYLQHAEHYNRRLAELNSKTKDHKTSNGSESLNVEIKPETRKEETPNKETSSKEN